MHTQTIARGGVTVLSGHASTGPRGFWEFSLDDIFPPNTAVEENITIIATPLESGSLETEPRPIFLVAKVSGRMIAVWSFTAAGVWAPSINFGFQCIRHDAI